MSKDDELVMETPHQKLRVRTQPAEATELRLADRLAAGVLNGPLTVALMLLCGFQLGTWIPHYLTWPWFADHDVFATLALGWEHGQLPYRDLAGNNFPGSIYLFWIVGKLFGWGRTVPFLALDASFVLIFGATLLAWSRRRFGRTLPGVVGFAVFLTYYLSQNFGTVAQRDWHGPFFILSGLLLAEAYPGRWSRVLAAATAAAGFAVRPQVVLFLPAMLALAIAQGTRTETEHDLEPGRTPWRPLRVLSGGALLLALFVMLLFLPLVLSGIFADFLHGVRLTFYGSSYNTTHTASILKQMLLQSLHLEFVLVPLGILFLAALSDPRTARTARVWLLAYLGAWFYKPLSPVPFPYLEMPLRLVCSINIALLVELLLTSRQAQPALRLVAVLLAVGLCVRAHPEMCSVAYSRRGIEALRRGSDAAEAPLGLHIALPADPKARSAFPWSDYRETLAYLRTQTDPTTRVANLVHVVPALNGPAGRLTSLPAESLAWLGVHPEDERHFAPALERAPAGSLVVWTPEKGRFVDLYNRYAEVQRLAPVIRRHYVPIARFGDIEVWKRTADPSGTLPAPAA